MSINILQAKEHNKGQLNNTNTTTRGKDFKYSGLLSPEKSSSLLEDSVDK